MIFKRRKYQPVEGSPTFMTKDDRRRRYRELIIIAVIVVVVVILTFFEGHIINFGVDLPVSNTVVLFILFNLNLLLVVLLIFLVFRNLIKLLYDRRRRVMGSRLRTRLVVAFVLLSLLPSVVLFIFSVSFISNSIQYWFNAPVERSLHNSLWVGEHYYKYIEDQSRFFMERAAYQVQNRGLLQAGKTNDLGRYIQIVQREFNFDGVEVYNLKERLSFSLGEKLQNEYFGTLRINDLLNDFQNTTVKTIVQDTPSGDLIKVVLPVPLGKLTGEIDGFLVATTVLDAGIIESIDYIARGVDEYEGLKVNQRPIQMIYIIALAIVAFVVLFCAVWVGFYLAKTISVPIRELAEGTRRVAQGNLDVTIGQVGDDEIGSLVNDFNQMIRDLRTNRYQLDLSTAQLRQQNTELEQRRQYIEIVLESVSAGVVTLSAEGYIVTINKSAENILHLKEEDVTDRQFLDVLRAEHYHLAPEMLEQLYPLAASHSLTLRLFIDEQPHSLLMTSTALVNSRGDHIGAVIVFDDLTELEKGERMAAWREVARRIAHEVKNPLTPISLSAQRLSRKYGQQIDDPVFAECTRVIIEHVELIRNIVNEFSNFARFPSSILQPGELIPIIEESLALYREANRDIDFSLNVKDAIPALSIDVMRMKQVFINLLDNGIAAMQGRGKIDITVKLNPARNHVQILVADNGPGLTAEAKTRIFEPDFSTKATGMGLGLTIVSTIIADHKGEISVVDNAMGGATFIIELPLG